MYRTKSCTRLELWIQILLPAERKAFHEVVYPAGAIGLNRAPRGATKVLSDLSGNNCETRANCKAASISLAWSCTRLVQSIPIVHPAERQTELSRIVYPAGAIDPNRVPRGAAT